MPAVSRLALLVEDEWLVRMEIADALQTAGWVILEACSGEEAMALLDEQHFDLLVTDLRLPGPLTGWDVADASRGRWPDIGVIYASANPATEARQVAHSVFLGKPSRVTELVASAERLWSDAPKRA